jgi:hypothetical protein
LSALPQLPFRHVLHTYPDGVDRPPVSYDCFDMRVSRVVSAIAAENQPDAAWACAVLNASVMASALAGSPPPLPPGLREALDRHCGCSLRKPGSPERPGGCVVCDGDCPHDASNDVEGW